MLRTLLGSPEPPDEPPYTPAWAGIESYHHLYAWRELNPDRLPDHSLYIGIAADLVMSRANTNLLVLGPAQGGGKTSGNVVPQALCARGPIVVTSSKGDTIAPLAMARSLLGEVWHYAPDGEKTPPGMRQLRWSPIPMCKDWDIAQLTAAAMISAARDPGATQSENSGFFADQAAYALAAVLFYAAHFGEDMRFVYSMVTNPW